MLRLRVTTTTASSSTNGLSGVFSWHCIATDSSSCVYCISEAHAVLCMGRTTGFRAIGLDDLNRSIIKTLLWRQQRRRSASLAKSTTTTPTVCFMCFILPRGFVLQTDLAGSEFRIAKIIQGTRLKVNGHVAHCI